MKYRIYFEPIDMEGNSPEHIKEIFRWEHIAASILKVLPLDKDGFIIEQPKAHAPL